MRCLGERGDRVFGRGVEVVGYDNAGDLAAGGTHVGHVDHSGVDLVQLDLGQRRFHVWFQRDGLDGDLGVGEHLSGDGAARDLGLHSATLTLLFARSVTLVTWAGLLGGTATSITFLTKFVDVDAPPALMTCCMFFGDAEANTSAGAPWLICSARSELAPKLSLTWLPGWSLSN